MGGHLGGAVRAAASLKRLAAAGLIAFPFVFPLAAGPSASAWQLLATWSSVALLLIIVPAATPNGALSLWLAGVAAVILVGQPAGAERWVPVCVALGVIYLSACLGAGLSRARRTSTLAWGLVAAGFISSLLGLLQYYGFAGALGALTTQAPELGQAYGNLRQRNQFATLIAMACVAALWLQASGDRRIRALLLPTGVLFIVGLAASTSRTGLLQLLAITGISALLARRERRTSAGSRASDHRLPPPSLLLAMVPVYFVAASLLPWLAGPTVQGMVDRISGNAPLAHSRLVLWDNVLHLIAQRPWTGWGWGELSFAHYSASYEGLRFAEILDNAHNLPLHFAVELGIPAALLVCLGFSWLVLAARPWGETDPARVMVWGLMGMVSLHSLLEYPLWYGPFHLVFGLALGFLWSSQNIDLRRSPVHGARRLAALALMSAAGYGAWDYNRVSQLYMIREVRAPAWRDDTLTKVQDSWLFANQVMFAELALMKVNARNAAEIHALARRLLHFSPEPHVIVKLIESAELLGFHDEALAQVEQFRIAFPLEYARWVHQAQMDGALE